MLLIKVVQNLIKCLSPLDLGLDYLLLADSDFGFKARRLVLALFTSMLKLIFFHLLSASGPLVVIVRFGL